MFQTERKALGKNKKTEQLKKMKGNNDVKYRQKGTDLTLIYIVSKYTESY